MSSLRRKFITVLAVLFCALLALSTALFMPKTKSADAKNVSNSANVLADLVVEYDSGAVGIDRDNLNKLYNRLNGNTANTTFETIANKAKAASTTNLPNLYGVNATEIANGDEFAVTFGGLKWAPVYLSRTGGTTGDVILTLWLSDILPEMQNFGISFAAFLGENDEGGFPSNMYSTSLVRSYITGSQYATSLNTLSTNSIQSSSWSNFEKYADYITTPGEVSWQLTQSATEWLIGKSVEKPQYIGQPWDNNLPNESSGKINIPNSAYWQGGDISGKTLYCAWANDIVWAPSLTETGSDIPYDGWDWYGIWRCTSNQLQSSKDVWLRSSVSHDMQYYLYASGAYDYYPVFTTNLGLGSIENRGGGVRPAFHLNLTKLEQAAKYHIVKPADDGMSPNYTGAEQTWNITEDTKLDYTLTKKADSLGTYASGAFKATNAGEYIVEATPKTGYVWKATGGTDAVKYTFKINPKPITLKILVSPNGHEEYVPPASITPSIETPAPPNDFVGNDDWVQLCAGVQFTAAQGTTKFNVDDLKTKSVGDYTITAELTLQNYAVTFTPADYKISAHTVHDFSGDWDTGSENSHWHVCKICGVATDTPESHKFVKDGDIQWSTNGGTKTEKCTDCGRTRVVNISSSDYNEVNLPAVSGTLVYNGGPQTVQLTGYDGDTMSAIEYYTSQGGTTAVTPQNAGTYYAKIALTDNGTKFSGTFERFVWIEFTIDKAPLTVTANDKQISYGDAAANDGVTYSGFVLTENESVLTGTLTYTYGDYAVGSGVGEYDILPAGLEAANYEIEFLKGTLEVIPKEITLTISDAEHNYGTAVATIGLEQPAAGVLVGNDTVDDILVLLSFVLKEKTAPYAEVTLSSTLNVGTYDITAEAGEYGNYNVTAFTAGTYTVNKGDYDMSVVEFDDGADYIYTGEEIEHTLTGTLPDGVSVEYWYEGVNGTDYASSQTPPTEMGSYKVTAKFTGNTDNYNDIDDITSTFTVSPAGIDAPVATDRKYVYDGTSQQLQFDSGFDDETMEVNYFDEDGNPLDGLPKNAGTYIVRVTSVNDNVKFNVDGVNKSFVEYTLTVEKAKLTVTAKDKEITYGDAAANDGVEYSGFVSNEDETVLSGELEYSYGEYVAGKDAGEYGISVSGLDADNYEIEYVAGKLNVLPKKITLTISDSGHKQGEEPATDYAFKQPAEGVLVGEDTLAVFDGITFTIKDGTGATVKLTSETAAGEYSITAADGVYGNYEITFVQGKYVVEEAEITEDPAAELESKKNAAKDALDKAAQDKKAEIDAAPDLTDEQKQAAKDKVDKELADGKAKIDGATDESGIESAESTAKTNINNIQIDPIAKDDGGSFPWWIIAVVAGLLVAAAVVIIVIKKRQTADGDDDFDNFYDDEYDYDEEEEIEEDDDF